MPQFSSPFANKNTLNQIPDSVNTANPEGGGEENKTDATKMNMSITDNETLNNNNDGSEPQTIIPNSEEDEGLIGELMLKDEPEEKTRPVAAFRRRLSFGKLNKSKSASQLNKGKEDQDNDSVSLVSSGSGGSRGRGRSRGRAVSMKEALETGSANIRDTIRSKSPSVLRRLRRRDSSDSCHQLVQDDDDDHGDPAFDNDGEKEEGDQSQQIVVADTNLLTSNQDEDDDIVSDDEETNYSQFQPSLNLSLRAERSMFKAEDDSLLQPLNGDGGGDPMVVVVTNTGYVSSDQGSLDLSIRSQEAATAPESTHSRSDRRGTKRVVSGKDQEEAPRTPSKRERGGLSRRKDRSILLETADAGPQSTHSRSNHTGTKSVEEEEPKTPSKRERGSLSKRHKDRAAKKKERHSVSPKRNSSVPKNGVTRPKRHSTAAAIPKRHSSVPKNAVSGKRGDSEHKRSSLANKKEKSPKRTKSPKKDRTSMSGKREKSPKREKKKKVVPVDAAANLEVDCRTR